MSIGQRIRHRRQSLKLKHIYVAYHAGVDTKSIYLIERDKCCPRIDTLQRIAAAIETTVGWIVGEVESPELIGEVK